MSFLLQAVRVGWELAARVDLLRAEILETHGVAAAMHEDILPAAIEIMRVGVRPSRVLLLANDRIHLYERASNQPHIATILIAPRTTNIGLLLSGLRALQLQEDTP